MLKTEEVLRFGTGSKVPVAWSPRVASGRVFRSFLVGWELFGLFRVQLASFVLD